MANTGGAWIRSDMKWHGDKVIAAVQKKEAALTAAGVLVQDAAHKLVKVKTGNLKGSITWALARQASPVSSPTKPEDGLRAHGGSPDYIYVGTNVKYARRIEYGFNGTDRLGRTYRQVAQPYLRPAYENQKNRIGRAIADILGPQIRGAGK